MRQRERSLVERLEGAAQACHAAMILSCEKTCREAAARIVALESEKVRSEFALAALHRELDGLRAFKRSVDEALNTGDGSYRP